MSWKTRATPVTEQPSSWKDRASVVESEKSDLMSDLSDLSRGAGQGLTLGASDEIVGAVQAAGDLITGNSDLDNLTESYRKYQQIQQQKNDEAQARSPYLYGGGELGGAIIPGLATAGAGAAATGASLGTRALLAARAGLAPGAVAAVAGSKKNIEDVGLEEKLKEAAEGAALGGLGGAAFSSLGSGAGKLGKMLKSTEKGQKIAESAILGTEGKLLSNLKDRQAITQDIINTAQDLSDNVINKLNENYSKKTELLRSSDKQIDFKTILNDALEMVDDQVKKFKLKPEEANALKEQINKNIYEKAPAEIKQQIQQSVSQKLIKLPSGEIIEGLPQTKFKGKNMSMDELTSNLEEGLPENMNPLSSEIGPRGIKTTTGLDIQKSVPGVERPPLGMEDAGNFVRSLQEAAFERKAVNPSEASILRQIAGRASDEIEKAIPEIKPLNKQSSSALEFFEQAGGPETLRNLPDGQKKVVSDQLIRTIENAFDTDDAVKLKNLQTQEGLLKSVFGEDTTKQIMDKIKKQSLRSKVLDETAYSKLKEGKMNTVSKLIGSAPEQLVNKAAYLGQTKPVRAAASLGQKLTDLPFDGVEAVAKQIENIPGLQSASIALRKGIANKDRAAVNAGMFLLLQNPEGRRLVTPTEE